MEDLRQTLTSRATDLALVVGRVLVHIITYGVIYNVHSKVMAMLNSKISVSQNASTYLLFETFCLVLCLSRLKIVSYLVAFCEEYCKTILLHPASFE